MYITKDKLKIMSYIYSKRRKGAKESALRKRFGDNGILNARAMIKTEFLFAINPDKSVITYETPESDWQTEKETLYHNTNKAIVEVEAYRQKLWMWGVPLTFSALALLISLINLLIKLLEVGFYCG